MSNINEILSDTDRGVGATPGILSAMFRKILIERNIGPAAWDRLMCRYMDDPRLEALGDTRERSSLRSNMNSALTDNNMTIRTFLRGLAFLRPERMSFSVSLQFADDHPIPRMAGKTRVFEREVEEDISGASGSSVLAKWYKDIDAAFSIVEEERQLLADIYCRDPRNGVSKDPDKRASTKGNLLKYFRSRTLSWINFHRCLLFLRPKTICFDVFLTWRVTKVETRHRLQYKTYFKNTQKVKNHE